MRQDHIKPFSALVVSDVSWSCVISQTECCNFMYMVTHNEIAVQDQTQVPTPQTAPCIRIPYWAAEQSKTCYNIHPMNLKVLKGIFYGLSSLLSAKCSSLSITNYAEQQSAVLTTWQNMYHTLLALWVFLHQFFELPRSLLRLVSHECQDLWLETLERLSHPIGDSFFSHDPGKLRFYLTGRSTWNAKVWEFRFLFHRSMTIKILSYTVNKNIYCMYVFRTMYNIIQ